MRLSVFAALTYSIPDTVHSYKSHQSNHIICCSSPARITHSTVKRTSWPGARNLRIVKFPVWSRFYPREKWFVFPTVGLCTIWCTCTGRRPCSVGSLLCRLCVRCESMEMEEESPEFEEESKPCENGNYSLYLLQVAVASTSLRFLSRVTSHHHHFFYLQPWAWFIMSKLTPPSTDHLLGADLSISLLMSHLIIYTLRALEEFSCIDSFSITSRCERTNSIAWWPINPRKSRELVEVLHTK